MAVVEIAIEIAIAIAEEDKRPAALYCGDTPILPIFVDFPPSLSPFVPTNETTQTSRIIHTTNASSCFWIMSTLFTVTVSIDQSLFLSLT